MSELDGSTENHADMWHVQLGTGDLRVMTLDQLDDAGTLVAQHHGSWAHPLALDDVEIGAADADGVDAHQRIGGPRPREIDLAHDERCARCLEQRRAHPHRRGPACRQSFAAMSLEGAISQIQVSA